MQEGGNVFISRLANWANWARGKAQYDHCRSIEHRYKTPQIWETTYPAISVDILDALKVEKAIIRLPECSRVILVMHHLYRADPRITSRKAGLNWHRYDQHLDHAEKMLQNILGCVTKQATT